MGGLCSVATKKSIYKPTMALRCLLWKAVLSSMLVLYVRHDDAAGCEEITGFVSLLVHVGDGRVKEEALEAEDT